MDDVHEPELITMQRLMQRGLDVRQQIHEHKVGEVHMLAHHIPFTLRAMRPLTSIWANPDERSTETPDDMTARYRTRGRCD
jgi:hypothetical protein